MILNVQSINLLFRYAYLEVIAKKAFQLTVQKALNVLSLDYSNQSHVYLVSSSGNKKNQYAKFALKVLFAFSVA